MTIMTRRECCKSYGSLSTCKLNCEFLGRVHIAGKYRKYKNTEDKTFAWNVLKSKWPPYNLSHFSNARWLDLKSQRILAFTEMANENSVCSANCHSSLPKTIEKNSDSVTCNHVKSQYYFDFIFQKESQIIWKIDRGIGHIQPEYIQIWSETT